LISRDELHFGTEATLNAAESGSAPLKVDKEGGVQATESKTRYIGAAVAALISRRAGDNDADRARGGAVVDQDPNIAGRSRNVGAAFGYRPL
jgi:hypothetical protein